MYPTDVGVVSRRKELLNIYSLDIDLLCGRLSLLLQQYKMDRRNAMQHHKP